MTLQLIIIVKVTQLLTLDKVLGPLSMFSNNHLSYSVFTESNWIRAGHDTVKVQLRPRAAIISSTAHGWHTTIPTSRFKLSVVEGDYRTQNADLADLLQAIDRAPMHTFPVLQTIMWSWWHSLPPLTPRNSRFSFLLIRKKLSQTEPLVWVTIQQIISFCQALPELQELHPTHFPRNATHCHVPAQLLRRAFEIWDLRESHQSALELNRAAADKIRGLNTTSVFWQRMQTLCPKTIFYPGPILKQSGEECRTDVELDEAMLTTRQFWFQNPISYDSEWTPTLSRY